MHGQQIQYESGEQRDNIGFWTNPDDFADWEITVTTPGRFEVTAEVAALGKSSLQVSAGEKAVTGETPATGDYGKFRRVKLGTLEISSPGKQVLTVRAVKDGWNPVNLRSLRLKPLQQ